MMHGSFQPFCADTEKSCTLACMDALLIIRVGQGQFFSLLRLSQILLLICVMARSSAPMMAKTYLVHSNYSFLYFKEVNADGTKCKFGIMMVIVQLYCTGDFIGISAGN